MSKLKYYQANSDVSCGEEWDGAILFNPDTDDTAVINTTGLILWQFLEIPHTVDEMVEFLNEKYEDMSTERGAEDVRKFVDDLLPDFMKEEDKVG